MSKEESDNYDNIMRAVRSVIHDCSKEEEAEIYSHILKQQKSFRIIDSIDTAGVDPLFDVLGGDRFRAGERE